MGPKKDSMDEVSQLKAELEKLRAENKALRSGDSKAGRPRVRRTENNQIAVLVDGRRWAVVLDPEQWKQLYTDKDRKEQIKALVTQMLAEKLSTTESNSAAKTGGEK